MSTPTAAAASRVSTTPRRSPSSSTAAPASTAYCQASLSTPASSTAEPRMAPIAAGPAAIGAIFGAAILLARALSVGWQWAVLAGAAVLLLALRRGVVLTLLSAAAVGLIIAFAGGPLPG